MDKSDLLRKKRTKILQAAAEHGTYNVRISGAVARGEATIKRLSPFFFKLERDSISS